MALQQASLVGFIGVTDADKARHFYRDILGLQLVDVQLPFALVFKTGDDAQGTMLRVTIVEKIAPHPFTTLGWSVSDIRSTIQQLRQSGVVFEIYKGLNDSNELPVWTAPGGTRIAWFKDPDGNLLSLQQDQ